MHGQEPWGVALVIFESERVVLPLGFDESPLDMDVMTEFNRAARKVCDGVHKPYSHENAANIAANMLAGMLRPVMENADATTDSDPLRIMLALVSRINNARYYILRVAEHDLFLHPMCGACVSDIHEQGERVLDLVEDERGELKFYYPVTKDVN